MTQTDLRSPDTYQIISTTLQCVAVCCSMSHIALSLCVYEDIDIAECGNTLQHTATLCNTLQHTAPSVCVRVCVGRYRHYSMRQYKFIYTRFDSFMCESWESWLPHIVRDTSQYALQRVAACCSVLQYVSDHPQSHKPNRSPIVRDISNHCLHVAVCCSVLQRVAACCSMSQITHSLTTQIDLRSSDTYQIIFPITNPSTPQPSPNVVLSGTLESPNSAVYYFFLKNCYHCYKTISCYVAPFLESNFLGFSPHFYISGYFFPLEHTWRFHTWRFHTWRFHTWRFHTWRFHTRRTLEAQKAQYTFLENWKKKIMITS